MLQWQAKRFLDASRSELGRSEIAIRKIGQRSPNFASLLFNDHLGLLAKQEQLEKAFYNTSNGNLGFLPLIVGGALILSVLGGGGLWFAKHYEETVTERKKLDCFDSLIAKNYTAEQALEMCKGLTEDKNIFDSLSNFVKLATGVSLVAIIAYYVLFRKKRK